MVTWTAVAADTAVEAVAFEVVVVVVAVVEAEQRRYQC